MTEIRAVGRLSILVAAMSAFSEAAPCAAQAVLRGVVVLEADADAEGPAEEAAAGAPGMMAFEYTEEMFDQWVYGGNGDGKDHRARLDRLLDLTVENVDRVCTLASAQKSKLQLAGRRDVQKFAERVEEARTKFQAVKSDQEKIGEVLQEIQPLQRLLQAGLFADGSFFSKTLKTLLTPAQAARHEREERERRAFAYEAKVHLIVAGLDDALGLLDDQREKLVRLLLAETRPLSAGSEFDYYLVLWQVSRIPEAKIRPLFDENQWIELQKQTAQMEGMAEMLRQQGLLPENEKPSDDKPAGDKPADAAVKRAKGDTP